MCQAACREKDPGQRHTRKRPCRVEVADMTRHSLRQVGILSISDTCQGL